MRRLGTAVGAVFALLLVGAGPAAADLPTPVDTSTFQDVTLAHSLTAPTVVKFAPNGLGTRMFVALKSGAVLAYDQPDDPNPTQVLDLSTEVDDFWDRGLLGMALSPGFNESGGYMYLLYARDAAIGGTPPRWSDACPNPPGDTVGGCVISGKLVRVPIGALGSPTGPVQTLIQDQWCQQFPSHSLGTVAFGPDGMLYVSAGEGANFNAPDWGQYGYPSINPCHDPFNSAHQNLSEGGALRAQDVRTGGDPAGLSGAIIRVNPATGAAAPGNPFSASPDLNKRKVIAYGMRNPFRFTFRPGTQDIWVGDVGWTNYEEIDKVPTGPPAENLGWPCREGFVDAQAYAQQSLCSTFTDALATDPKFIYPHWDDVVAGDGCANTSGSAISGVAFLPDTSAYPARFRGGLFFTDYARDCIWFAPPASPGGDPDFSHAEVFARSPNAGVGPVDLEIAPDGNLVFVFHDQTFGEIHEIRPLDQPTAKIDVTDHDGHSFTFDGSSSTPAGLTYAWDIDGDGFDDGSGATLDHTFAGRAAETVRLRVTKSGISDTTSVRVSVGNTPPSNPQITKVSVPAEWATGDHLKFSGAADDPDPGDDGHLTYTWVMTILHCPSGAGCHKHPIQSLTGPTAEFVAPAHAYPSKLLITLQATDTLGFSSDLASLELDPRAIDFTTRATPSPFTVSLDGIQGNSVAETLIAGTPVTVSTTTPQLLGGRPYGFAGWSDGDRHLARTVAPRTTSTLTARFVRLPASTAAPTIVGDARTGHTLTGSPGGWTDATSLSYQWLRCVASCAAIPGATARTYGLGAADLGARLLLRVIARNAGGAVSALSARSATITDGIAPALRLGGTRKVKLGQGRLRVRVHCPSERCRLRLTPVLLVKGRAPIATSRVTKGSLGAGQKATLTVRLSTKQRRAAAKALDAHKRAKVRVDVTATDMSGNRTARSFTVTLKP